MPNTTFFCHEVFNQWLFVNAKFSWLNAMFHHYLIMNLVMFQMFQTFHSLVFSSNVISVSLMKILELHSTCTIPYLHNLLRGQSWEGLTILSLWLFNFNKPYTCKQCKQLQATCKFKVWGGNTSNTKRGK